MGSPRNVRLVTSRRPPSQPASKPAPKGSGPVGRRPRSQGGAVQARERVAPRRARAGSGAHGGIPGRIAGAIGALAGAVLSLFQGGPPHRAGRGPRRRDEPQRLHNTFRSGSAAPAGNSLRGRDGGGGLRRSAGGGASSVIGQPLVRSSAHRRGRPARGSGYLHPRGGRPSYARRYRKDASAPLRPLTIAVTGASLAILLFLGSSFVSKAPAGMDPDTEAPLLDIPLLSPTAFPISTDPSSWRAGEMPHLYQTDVRWSWLPYGGGDVATNACGPTVMSMLYVYFTGGTDMDPGAMAAWADYNNYAPTGATEWAFMTEAAAAFGFSGEMVNPTRETIEGALRAGSPVVCVVNPGDFTNVGHYIILKSIDDFAMVEVYDPNSPERSARKWDIVRVLNQTDVAWVYSSY